MKKAIYSFLLFILLIGGCVFAPDPPGSSDFDFISVIITGTEQYYNDFYKKWETLKVYYTMENVGDGFIETYIIHFEVTFVDFTTKESITIGSDLDVGEIRDEYAYLNISGKEAKDIKVVDQEINP